MPARSAVLAKFLRARFRPIRAVSTRRTAQSCIDPAFWAEPFAASGDGHVRPKAKGAQTRSPTPKANARSPPDGPKWLVLKPSPEVAARLAHRCVTATGPLLVVYNAEKVADNSQLLVNPFHSLTYLLRRIAFAGTHHAGWLRTRDASWLRPSRLRPTITKTGLRPRWMWRRSRRCRCSGLTLTLTPNPDLNPNPNP